MIAHYRRFFYFGLIILLLGLVTACAQRGYQARHLAADISLLTPGLSAREVQAVMGPPDYLRPAADGGEEWLYLEVRQSRMRRSQMVGRWLGHEDYHLAILTIREGTLTDSIYRAPTAAEFHQLGGTPDPQDQ